MSHLFEALQRSDAERSGVDPSAVESVTAVLERAERNAASQWRIGASDEECRELESVDSPRIVSSESSSPDLRAAVRSDPQHSTGADTPWEILHRCRTVQEPLPARGRLVSLTDKESAAAEAFRLLSVRLRHLRRDKPLKKLLITSTTPQEGKSFVAANLACTIALGKGQRTLLMDGDLRRPSLAQIFGLGAVSGLAEQLQSERNMASTIYYLEGPGVWVLPAGNTPSNPLELIQSAKLPLLLDELAGWFDWIIIDSPPILPLADTSVWARFADGILLVTRQGTTEKRKLKRGLEVLEPKKVVGALLNSFTGAPEKDYYYYRPTPSTSQPIDASAN